MLNTPINVLTLSRKKGEWVAIRQCIFGGGGPQSALLSLLELEPFFVLIISIYLIFPFLSLLDRNRIMVKNNNKM